MSNSLKGKVHSNETIQGLDGVGIESVEQIEKSSEDGGINVIRITRTDGKETDIEIRNGSKGSDGRDGADGINGKDGEDGKTAYQYAKEGGYAGTEEEFAVKLAQENVTKEEVSKLSEDIATKASAIKEKASGEVIVVADSDEAKPLGLVIDGKSEQNQYSGKNLIPYPYPRTTNTTEGIVFTVLDNGAIKYNGTSTGYATFAFCNDWKPNKGTYKKNVGEKCNFTVSRYLRSSDSYYSVIANNETTQFSTTDWDFETYKYKILLQVIPSHGAVDNVFYPMICLSTETDMDTYEPYVGGKPSPSTEYRQEIRNIGVYDEASGKYAVEVKGTGKNVFKHSLVSQIINGVTITVDETIKASGTTEKEITRYLFGNTTNPIVSDKNGLFIKGAKTLIGMDYKAKIVREDGIIAWTSIGTNGLYVKPNSKIEEIYLQVRYSGTSVSVEIEPQIVEGNVDLPFEPYEETTAKVLLPQPLRKGDKAYWNGGSKVRVDRYRDVEVFDGSDDEGWRYDDTSTQTTKRCCTQKFSSIIKRVSVNSDIPSILCDSYIATSANKTYTSNKGISVDIGGWLHVYDEEYNTSDISLWKAHLTENPITLEYPLATPITEEIDIDLGELTMFYPTTILSNDCNANMEVTYIADTKAYVDKKFAELATAMV